MHDSLNFGHLAAGLTNSTRVTAERVTPPERYASHR